MADAIEALKAMVDEEENVQTINSSSASAEDLRSFVQWTINNGKFFPVPKTQTALLPGYYQIGLDQYNSGNHYFEHMPVSTEDLVRFPDANSDKIIEEIRLFWKIKKEAFHAMGLMYKRGIMLYGPQGTGKSCTVRLVCEDVIKRGGIAVSWTDIAFMPGGLRLLRMIEPETPIVVLMEDIDSILEDQNESDVLNLLDGINCIEQIVFLATTNYASKLQGRVVNRPNRFDRRFYIGPLNGECRKLYLEHMAKKYMKAKGTKLEIDDWIDDTEGMSIAHLRELFVQVALMETDYDVALQDLRDMQVKITDDEEFDRQVGFATTTSSKKEKDKKKRRRRASADAEEDGGKEPLPVEEPAAGTSP